MAPPRSTCGAHFHVLICKCERVSIFEAVHEYICMPAVPKMPKSASPARRNPESTFQMPDPMSSRTVQKNAMLPNTEREVMKRTVIKPN